MSSGQRRGEPAAVPAAPGSYGPYAHERTERTVAKLKAANLDPNHIKHLYRLKLDLQKAQKDGDVAAAAQIYLKLGAAMQREGIFDKCLICYSKAAQYFRKLGDRQSEAEAREAKAFLYHHFGDVSRLPVHGDPADRVEGFNKAIQFDADRTTADRAALSHAALRSVVDGAREISLEAAVHDPQSQVLLAVYLLQRQHAQAANDKHREASALERLGKLYQDVGAYGQSMKAFEAVLGLTDDPGTRTTAHYELGRTQQIAGHRAAAVSNLGKQLEIATAQGDAFGAHQACMALGPLYAESPAAGDGAKAAWVLQLAVTSAETLGDRVLVRQAQARLDKTTRKDDIGSDGMAPSDDAAVAAVPRRQKGTMKRGAQRLSRMFKGLGEGSGSKDSAAKPGGGGGGGGRTSWRKSISKRLSKKPPNVVIRKSSLRASGIDWGNSAPEPLPPTSEEGENELDGQPSNAASAGSSTLAKLTGGGGPGRGRVASDESVPTMSVTPMPPDSPDDSSGWPSEWHDGDRSPRPAHEAGILEVTSRSVSGDVGDVPGGSGSAVLAALGGPVDVPGDAPVARRRSLADRRAGPVPIQLAMPPGSSDGGGRGGGGGVHRVQSQLATAPELMMPPPPSPFRAPLSPKPEEIYVAIFDYTPKVGAEHEELALTKDDLVTDLTKLNDGWYFGTNQRNGAMGMLPANFVKLNHLVLQDHVAM